MDYFQKQNLIFFDFLNDLFEFKKYRNWETLAKSITELKMKRTYRKFAELFPRKMDYAAELEKLPDGFKMIHYSRLKGTTIIDEVVRFSLYTDTIVVFHPLQNPAITNQQMNPGKDPRLWLPDFINALYFYIVLQKWVRAGIVKLVVNPFDYNEEWYKRILAEATERVDKADKSDPVLMEQTQLALADQLASGWGKNDSEADIKAALLAMKNPVYTPDEAERFARQIKAAIPKINPLYPHLPKNLITSQIMTEKGGGPLESILAIAELTGGNIYTPDRFHWHSLQQIHLDEFWVKLGYVYSKVDLPFLNHVSTDFALQIRQEERLSGVRKEMKTLFTDLKDKPIDEISEKKVKELYEGFTDEIRKSSAEWDAIKKEAEIARQHLLVGSLAIPAMVTHPATIVPIALLTGNSMVNSIRSAKLKQKTFRAQNPVSVFVDVQRQPEGFFAQLKNCIL